MIRRAVKLVLYTAALGGGALLAAAVNRPTVEGSGVTATEERDISDVTEVSLSGDGIVTIVRGDYASVSVTADDNILPHLKTDTSGRTLRIGGSSVSIRSKSKPEYRVTLPKLEALSVSGAGHATVDKPVGDELKVKLSGAGTVTLRDVTYQSLNVTTSGAGKVTATGAATRTQFKLSGAGGLDAAGLRSSFADVQVSGAGQASVWATVDLKARVSGAGGVKYKGSPGVEQKVSGAGRVRPMD
jgi:hypothetical protein